MRKGLFVSVGMTLLMLGGSVGAWVATPTRKVADIRHPVDIERIVPTNFADWRVDDTIVPVQADPSVQAQLKHIYAQTLSRTYVNARGDRVMLVIAYGSDQSDEMAVHKPEVCYPAQGFEVIQNRSGSLDTGFGVVPVTELVARQPSRYEPITYWIRVGDAIDGTGLRRKLTQLKYGMTGLIPDGMLFRVSSIGPDAGAFALQREFTRALVASLDDKGRQFILGHTSSPAVAVAAASRQE